MRKLALVLAALAALLLAPSALANGPIVMANFSNSTPNPTGCWSFHPEVSGTWGGEWGEGAVTAFPSDSDDGGHCVLTWATGEKARRIELRVLDGIADDSFAVYVENPGGKMVLVYSYTDQYTTEEWITHNIYSFPAGKGQGPMVHVYIVPTNVGWWGFDTWGQLGVDYIALYEH